MRSDIMIDIETMGHGPEAAVMAVGLCVMHFDGRHWAVGKSVEFRATLQSNVDEGRGIGAGTVEWWLKQSDAARRRLLLEPREDIRTVACLVRGWIQRHRSERGGVWGNGPTFDNVIVRNLLISLGRGEGWRYPHERDVRTMKDIDQEMFDGCNFAVALSQNDCAHGAEADARAQAAAVVGVRNALLALRSGT